MFSTIVAALLFVFIGLPLIIGILYFIFKLVSGGLSLQHEALPNQDLNRANGLNHSKKASESEVNSKEKPSAPNSLNPAALFLLVLSCLVGLTLVIVIVSKL